ncbi:UDP-N-acetylmuramate--L-alanine ligase [Propionimicrobium lymphophilum]|uniref:UDP-N-acetylmuramate--L-alanine ligase n=1 Tax=Propionimicrobium lymphophilum TaxID=33012 RepID=UPI000425B868|nr:UDP-N-acetylmuramate--L-alanine ligase [Propionimicrobium lymphophilum]
MSLIEPVELVPASQAGSLHFLAIGGAGMSGLAFAYQELGACVSGCDQVESKNLRRLAAAGVPVSVGHDVNHLDGVDTLVVSSAIRQENVELVEARKRGLRVWHRSAALAALMIGKIGISVAGTHGKTTTSAMIAEILTEVGAKPSYVIGSPLASTSSSAELAEGDAFVVEADESDGSFLQYPTNIAVVTNIEADHLDNWHTTNNYHDGFTKFATATSVRHVVACADDPGAAELAEIVRSGGGKVTTYGESEKADVSLSDFNFDGLHAQTTLHTADGDFRLALQVPGKHNLLNAAAAFIVARLLGCEPAEISAAAAKFTGTFRRFQAVGAVDLPDGRVHIYDDYAHHPTELRAALKAARKVNPNGRLIACFQPHLYSRTQEFAEEFGQALSLADVAVVTDVYASREDPIEGVTGRLVVDKIDGPEVHYVEDKSELPAQLARICRGGDLVLTLGAGDVTIVGPLLVDQLAEAGASVVAR